MNLDVTISISMAKKKIEISHADDAPNQQDKISAGEEPTIESVSSKKKPTEIKVTFHDEEEDSGGNTEQVNIESEEQATEAITEAELSEGGIDIKDFSDTQVEQEEKYLDELQKIEIDEISDEPSLEDEATAMKQLDQLADTAVESEESLAPTATIEEAIQKSEAHSQLKDDEIDKAVDEIVSAESDKLLEAQDEELEYTNLPDPKPSFSDRVKSFFRTWWEVRSLRYGTLIILFLALVVGGLVPKTRYAVMNTLGIRVRSSMAIVDSKTRLPLKNIQVSLQGHALRSDDDGVVVFEGLKQGPAKLEIDKRGYAVYEKDLVLGWGSNPLGEQPLTATGTQFIFLTKDWMSDKVIVDVEVISGEDIAKSDSEGKTTLTVGDVADDAEVKIIANGYREEIFTIGELSREENIVKLVPSKKHAFVSNRDGRYNLYAIDVDAKNEELLLEATGKEREIPFILPHQTRDVIAYISSRDGDTNKDNFMLDGLFIIDLIDGSSYKVTRSEQIQLIGWYGDKLIYVNVIEGASAGNSERSKIVSYDLQTKGRTELASANYFNDVKLIQDTVYYAVSSYSVPQSQAKLYTIKTDATEKKELIGTQVWSITRLSFTNLLFDTIDLAWYEQELGKEPVKLDAQPANRVSRTYTVSPNGKKAAWVDVRDGKGVLLVYDVTSGEEATVLTEPGLSDPVYWTSDSYLVYRISTSEESSDYVLNIDGGVPQKISDVVGNRSRYFY